MKHFFSKVTIYTWISIGFPIYLIAFEFMLHNLFKVEISSFIGPSLASSGMGFLIECIKPKKIKSPPTLIGILGEDFGRYELRDKKDERRVIFSWIYVVICTAIWVYVCSISIKSLEDVSTSVYNSTYFWSIGLGTFNYIVGISLLFMKEQIEDSYSLNFSDQSSS